MGWISPKIKKQAGAELGQAQLKLELDFTKERCRAIFLKEYFCHAE